MILGVGTDICNVERIKSSLDKFGRKFVERICTPTEIEVIDNKADIYKSLAKTFAAKEAVSKAFGTGIGQELSFLDIEIYHNVKGKPFIKLSDKAKQIFAGKSFNVEISISDDDPYAVAFVVIEGIKDE